MDLNSPVFLTIKRMAVAVISSAFVLLAYKLNLEVTEAQIEAFSWIIVGYLLQSAFRQVGTEKAAAAVVVADAKAATVTDTTAAVDVLKAP